MSDLDTLEQAIAHVSAARALMDRCAFQSRATEAIARTLTALQLQMRGVQSDIAQRSTSGMSHPPPRPG